MPAAHWHFYTRLINDILYLSILLQVLEFLPVTNQKPENSEKATENIEKIESLTSPNFIQCSAKEENVEIRKAFSHLYYQGTR